ncbi:MAG TPA: hypothetical protein VNK70_01885 [Candidatus Paceibacterota bacterium]|nr:hypothetical protein [Candidatus Paceibacterota bacterium]
MAKIFKKFVIVVIIAVAVTGWWFGAYLPFQKSKMFIEVIRSGSVIKTVDMLEQRFDAVLGFPSPIGKDEVVGFFADQMVSVLGTKPPKEIGTRLIAYTEDRVRGVLENPRSPELTKVLLKMASLNELGWVVYQNEVYFRAAEKYLYQCLEVSPNRPQCLYGLFNIYANSGLKAEAKAVGEKIIGFWPEDKVMRSKINLL